MTFLLSLLRGLGRWLLRLVLLLLVAVIGYVGYAHWAWRDLPAAAVEQKYGGPEVRTAMVDGVALRYRLEGEGPPLVLIHSHYLDMRLWDGWLPQLTPHFRVLRYDLSGHGLTGPDPSGVYTVQRDVLLLNGLLDQLGIGRAAVVGSSLGGNIAFTLAAQQPERVSALVLINSGGLKRANSRSSGEIPSWADHFMPLIPPAALTAFLRWMTADDRVVTPAEEQRFVDLWRREGNRVAELARLRQYRTGEPDPLLARIIAPALVLWGEDNPQLPVELSAQFVEKLSASPRVQRKTYPGAGHVLPLERPAESVADTLSFLEALAP
jgi:pimeloyl-ACP methyl ester carboxylesterase